MSLLWIILLIVLILALAGGIFLTKWLLIFLVVAAVLAFLGSRRA